MESVTSDAEVAKAVSASTFADRFPVNRVTLFGSTMTVNEEGEIVAALGTSVVYRLDDSLLTVRL